MPLKIKLPEAVLEAGCRFKKHGICTVYFVVQRVLGLFLLLLLLLLKNVFIVICLSMTATLLQAEDLVYELQTNAIQNGKADLAHWGWKADEYMLWGTHSNRLIPVYTFGSKSAGEGMDLADYAGGNSPYRSSAAIRQIYGRVPSGTYNPAANYFDQTNIYDIQLAALRSGKKHIFLVIFDGMDWQTTQAAAIWKSQKHDYDSGRGSGLHFQDYGAAGTSQFGMMVTSPYADDLSGHVNSQKVSRSGKIQFGGYSAEVGGPFPWSRPVDELYPIGRSKTEGMQHAYTDSASSATSMTTGYKTYNGAINVSPEGTQLTPIAHQAKQAGWKVGTVTSVQISHATPAASYAHNVSRSDYQDLARDLLGLPSVSHPQQATAGLDVLIGCGHGVIRNLDTGQGSNFVPGNGFLTEKDQLAIDSRSGGKYTLAMRTQGQSGAALLKLKADDAIEQNQRLFGFFGTRYGHLPYQTADGKFNPPVGRSKTAEQYSEADLLENPTLSDFTEQAIRVLSQNDSPFWLMVEAGDVDWANHDNNIDCSIGAVLSGDAAVETITNWVDKHSNWEESLMIVTADHGHYLVLKQPERLLKKSAPAQKKQSVKK